VVSVFEYTLTGIEVSNPISGAHERLVNFLADPVALRHMVTADPREVDPRRDVAVHPGVVTERGRALDHCGGGRATLSRSPFVRNLARTSCQELLRQARLELTWSILSVHSASLLTGAGQQPARAAGPPVTQPEGFADHGGRHHPWSQPVPAPVWAWARYSPRN